MQQAGPHVEVTLQNAVLIKVAEYNQKEVTKQVMYLYNWDASGEAMILVSKLYTVEVSSIWWNRERNS